MVKIGVLALQGAFAEHIEILRELGVEAVEVRLPHHLEGLDGLIIPGGESTTMGKLAEGYGLMAPLRLFASTKPVWGTCAGMIMLAKEVGTNQPVLGLMDIAVERNAFGRQVESFETMLDVPSLRDGSRPFPAVFIRAPRVADSAGNHGVTVMARLDDGTAVAARQDHWLVTSFHPELTGDHRFHEYFVKMILEEKEGLSENLDRSSL